MKVGDVVDALIALIEQRPGSENWECLIEGADNLGTPVLDEVNYLEGSSLEGWVALRSSDYDNPARY